MKWRRRKIANLGRVVTGKTPATSNREFFDGEYMFVTPSDINYAHYFCRATESTVTDLARQRYKNQFIPAGSVMFTCIGNTIGKCAIACSECLTNQQINSVITNKETDAKFIYYLLCNNVSLIKSLGGGAATPIINKSTFQNIEFSIPDADEQRRIAEVLEAHDDLIDINSRRIGFLEAAARQLYTEWFARLHYPGHPRTRRITSLPKGWARRPLGEVCAEVRDTAAPDECEPDSPYIGLEHIPRRSIALCEWGRAEEVTSTKHRFRTGDILFGKIRPYFHKVGVAFVDGVASSDAIVLRPTAAEWHSLALLTVSSDAFVADASKTAREGSKMPRADWKLMRTRPVPVPPETLLRTFNAQIEPIVSQLKTLTFQNRRLRTARDLLLPRLMNGDINA